MTTSDIGFYVEELPPFRRALNLRGRLKPKKMAEVLADNLDLLPRSFTTPEAFEIFGSKDYLARMYCAIALRSLEKNGLVSEVERGKNQVITWTKTAKRAPGK